MVTSSLRLALVLLSLALGVTSRALAQSDDLSALNRQAVELYRAGKYGEAAEIAQQFAAAVKAKRGDSHLEYAKAIGWLASIYQAQGRYPEAEAAFKRSLAISEQALGPAHPDVASSLNNLAELYRAQARYSEAEPLYNRSLAICEKAFGPEHTCVATVLNNLALLYGFQGRYTDAEPIFKRSLAIRENSLGSDHRDVAQSLNNLGQLYRLQGRYAETKPLLERSLIIGEKAFGPDHPNIVQSINNLAGLFREEREYAKAEPLYMRSLAIRERTLGPDHPLTGNALNSLAVLYSEQRRYSEAEALYKRSLAIQEKTLGPAHPDVATTLNNLGHIYRLQERYTDAVPVLKRSLTIRETTLGPDHPDVGLTLNILGSVHFEQAQWRDAVESLRRGSAVATRRAQRGDEIALTGKADSDPVRQAIAFSWLVKAAHRSVQDNIETAPELAASMFQVAQWARGSAAGTSLAQMAARLARGTDTLGLLVRERQDLVGEWWRKDRMLTASLSQAPNRRNSKQEEELRARLAAIDARIAEMDLTLREKFPDYASLTSPNPLSIAEAQALLRDNEALVFFLDTGAWKPTPEETFLWVVTRTGMRWLRSELGSHALASYATALRCGLDPAAWDGSGAASCAAQLKTAHGAADSIAGNPLPFDLARAHELYQKLFEPIADILKDMHLLIVPSGPLTALPFQVLVTEKPATANITSTMGYAEAAWLAKRHAITVLPTVASLKALRAFGARSKAEQPFIGFGNPLLTGPDGRDRRAWDRQSCGDQSIPLQVASRSVRSSVTKFFRSGLANVEEVRAQYPLPETADELCEVAKSVGAPGAAVYLGEKATETVIKRLSIDGRLAKARIVHFATHGLLAGETEMLATVKAEPALLLTPPNQPSEEDDGLLTASEITQLKLDAEWIVLSACNTAAGETDTPGAESLSGLARAFFYAGARALLVSHWAVNSEATVKLITKVFDELKTDPNIGRAEAVRRSMLALIGKGGSYAHPTNWAPFVVVGEGAR